MHLMSLEVGEGRHSSSFLQLFSLTGGGEVCVAGTVDENVLYLIRFICAAENKFGLQTDL